MGKKTLVYIVAILLTTLFVGVGIYFKKDGQLSNNDLNNGTVTDLNTPVAGEENVLIKDSFSISIPQGWEETQAPMGVSAIAVNTSEEVNDPAAQKINFRSYLSVSYDSLQGKNKEEYIKYVKSSLEQLSTDVNFIEDKQIMVGGKEAQAMEIEIIQQGVNFKVLLVLIWGENEDIWVMGFNTTKDKWGEYNSLFYQTASTFQIKK